jgi:hypothetical protein
LHQVLLTIIVRSVREIRAHKLLSLRALIVGWVFLLIVNWPVLLLANPFAHPWLFGTLDNWVLDAGVVPATWRSHAMNRFGLLVLGYISFGGAGWMVARLHWVHRTSMVLAFLASVLVASLPYLYLPSVALFQGRERIEPLLINGVLVFGGRTASVLLGGLWSGRRRLT